MTPVETRTAVERITAALDEAEKRLDAATPTPWFAHFTVHGDPSIVSDADRPMFSKVAWASTMPDDYGRANTLLIVECVNARRAQIKHARDVLARHRHERFQVGSKTHGGPPEYEIQCVPCGRRDCREVASLLAVWTLARHHPMRVTGGDIGITQEGLDYVGVNVGAPLTTDELLALWRSVLKAGARQMLDVLIGIYPDGTSREQLAAEIGMTATGGTFHTYLSTLRRNGLIDINGGTVTASSSLFLGGARMTIEVQPPREQPHRQPRLSRTSLVLGRGTADDTELTPEGL